MGAALHTALYPSQTDQPAPAFVSALPVPGGPSLPDAGQDTGGWAPDAGEEAPPPDADSDGEPTSCEENDLLRPNAERDAWGYNRELRRAIRGITTCLQCDQEVQHCNCCNCVAQLDGQLHPRADSCATAKTGDPFPAPRNVGLWRKALFDIAMADQPIVMPLELWKQLLPWVSNIWMLNGRKGLDTAKKLTLICRYYRATAIKRQGGSKRTKVGDHDPVAVMVER